MNTIGRIGVPNIGTDSAIEQYSSAKCLRFGMVDIAPKSAVFRLQYDRCMEVRNW